MSVLVTHHSSLITGAKRHAPVGEQPPERVDVRLGSVAWIAGEPAEPGPAGERPNGGHPITVVVKVALQAIALPEDEGGYSVIVPALPGCVSQGETIEEVQANIVEAAEGWLEATHDQNKEQAIRDASE